MHTRLTGASRAGGLGYINEIVDKVNNFTLNEVKGLKTVLGEILRFAQNDTVEGFFNGLKYLIGGVRVMKIIGVTPYGASINAEVPSGTRPATVWRARPNDRKVGQVGKFLLALTALLVVIGCQSGPTEQNNSALEMVSSPWVGCDIGSFVHYKILMTAGNFAEEKQTVLEIRRNQVVLEVSLLGNNDEWEHKNMVIAPLKVMGRPEKTIKVTEDTITIKGKLLRCKVEKQVGYDTEHDNKKIVMRTWMSDDVPGGVVRISHNDAIAVEVVDFEKK